jgi:hypothetical protein
MSDDSGNLVDVGRTSDSCGAPAREMRGVFDITPEDVRIGC